MLNCSEGLEFACRRLDQCRDLVAAADCLIEVGRHIGMPHPAVIDDYSSDRLLTTEDGRALASVLGWQADYFEKWLSKKLYLVSPIAAVCRVSTRPFAWDAATMAAAIEQTQRRAVDWPLTPLHGFFGGITVPIHLPRGRTGSVSWYSREPNLDTRVVLAEFEFWIRVAGHRFMDLVYAIRAERAPPPSAHAPLSERELECLAWAAVGRTDAEIAALIYRSPTTARFHIDNAVRKLGARNRTQAVAMAAELGLIHPLDRSDRRLD